jgi:hypothetical protein
MNKPVLKGIERMRSLLVVAVLAVIAVVAGAQVVAGGPTTPPCSIGSMLSEYGITVVATVASDQADSASLLEATRGLYRDGVVGEQTSAILASSRIPIVDGRLSTVVRVDNATPPVPGGSPAPDGRAAAPRPDDYFICTIAIFDAATGELLVSMGDAVER